MNPSLIFQLVELAISLAQSQLSGRETEHALLRIVRKGVQAYEDHIGETLDPLLIKAAAQVEDPI